jgi:hypothetical protein
MQGMLLMDASEKMDSLNLLRCRAVLIAYVTTLFQPVVTVTPRHTTLLMPTAFSARADGWRPLLRFA